MTAVAETAAALREKAADLFAQAEQLEAGLRPNQVAVDRDELATVLNHVQVHPGQASVIASCNSVASALNRAYSIAAEGDLT